MSTDPPSLGSVSRQDLDRLIRGLQGRRPDPGQERIPRRPPDVGPAPASTAQERLWFLDRYEEGSARYNVPGALTLEGMLDRRALRAALSGVLERHEALRTHLEEREGDVFQVVSPPSAVDLPVIDLEALGPETGEREVRRLAEREAARAFDLGRAPLARFLLVSSGTGRSVLLATIHHAVCDGVSIDRVLVDLSALYRRETVKEDGRLPDLPVRYGDYAAWERSRLASGEWDGHLEYWREALAGVQPLELVGDRARPQARTGHGGLVPVTLPRELVSGLRHLGRGVGSTLFGVLLALVGELLGRRGVTDDLVIGTPVANRSRSELLEVVGLFVNTVPLRLDRSGAPSARELVGRAARRLAEAQGHQEIPFARLVEELEPDSDPTRPTLLRVVLALRPASSPAGFPGLRTDLLRVHNGSAKFDLSFELEEDGAGDLTGHVEYASDLFDRTTVQRLWWHVETLARGAVADPSRPIRRLPVMPPGERHQTLVEWNDTATRRNRSESVIDRFERCVNRRPDAIALIEGDAHLSYRMLQRRSEVLARKLADRGVGPETAVGLLMERSRDLVVAILGVLSAGGFYVPLQVGEPRDRLLGILEDAGTKLVLTSDPAASLPGFRGELLSLAGVEWTEGVGEGAAHCRRIGGEALAYVMFTSGSTGRPKGVAVPDRGVLRLVERPPSGTHRLISGEANLGPDEVLLQLAPAAFDASTLELWGALLHGAALVMAPPGALSLEELSRILARHRVTTLWLTAGLFHQVVEGAPAGWREVRQLLAGGDVLSPEHVRSVLAAPGDTGVINGYGPTENTTFTTCWRMRSPADVGAPGEPVPIGRPIGDTRLYLLDAELAPVALGATGELCTGGDGLARGYLGRPALTAEKLVPDPVSGEPGARLYRTGDRARLRADGVVLFLGRLDAQLKLRGFRIEPGEIESSLAGHPAVASAAVVLRNDRLVAYLLPARDDLPEAAALSAYLGERLPAYMVPSAFVRLDALPLNRNGKVDRELLVTEGPEPDRGVPRSTTSEPPRTPTEESVARAFEDLLELAPVGRDDDFFDLGGHSLVATRLVSRLRADLGVELPLRRIFEGRTVAELAAAVESARRDATMPPIEALPPEERRAGIPASFAQRRLWFLDRLDPGRSVYNLPVRLELSGALDLPGLVAAFERVAERHEVLRTIFEDRQGETFQVVQPSGSVPCGVVDLTSLPGDRREGAARALARAEAARAFDLARGPLLRTLLVRRDRRLHDLVVHLHHAVADGWSLGPLFRDLSAAAADGARPLPELPIQYGDYAVWQRRSLTGEAVEEQVAYWRERLRGLPALELPTDRRRPVGRSRRSGSVPVRISGATTAGVGALARASGATPFMVLLALFQVLLARLAGQDDFAVGSPVANRTTREVEDLVGFFVNTLVLRADLTGNPTFGAALAAVRASCLDAYARQDVPFEMLVEDLSPERRLDTTPFFRVFFNLYNAELELPKLAGVEVTGELVDPGEPKFDLSLGLTEREGALFGFLDFDRELFDTATARLLARRFETGLAVAVAGPGTPVRDLSVIPPEERHQLLVEWGRRGGDPAAPTGLVPMPAAFERRAAERPDAVAVVASDGTLTYGELERRSRDLACRLRRLGVGPDRRVAVQKERSVDLVVSLLAVLRSGGEYVPVDPAYPAERVELMIADSGALLVLDDDRSLEASGAGDPAGDGLPAISPELPAYVIYTSGSTGRPKGVRISHRAFASFLDSMAWAPGLEAGDRLLSVTTPSFDIAGLEMMLPLRVGGTVVLASREVLADGVRLARSVEAHRPRVMQATPATWRLLVDSGWAPRPPLRVLSGGEALPRDLADALGAVGAEVWNLYGPTETTVWSSIERVDNAPGNGVTVGRPIANTSIHLVDDRLRLVPRGTSGELCIGGAGLALGYLGRPAVTAERFVPHPFPSEPGARLYRTGDLARRLGDGRIEHLGRFDHQVKVRGFRVEPGEIEAALRSHPGVSTCVVVARGEAAEKSLVAYVVAAEEGLDAARLRAHAAKHLPAHMVPSSVVFLAALPSTPNGKVDRAALPEPRPTLGGGTGPKRPATATEDLVAEVWRSVLQVEEVGRESDFFALGGHSLLANRVVVRLQEATGVELPLRAVFEQPTVAGVAAALDAVRDGSGGAEARLPLVPGDETGPIPLSFGQRRLWFLQQIAPESPLYNFPAALRFRGPLSVAALSGALDEVRRRHEALRTRFDPGDGEPVQVVDPPTSAQVPVVDLSGLPETERRRQVARLEREEADRPFRLGEKPPVRHHLLRLGPDHHVGLFTLHHIVVDDRSVGILMRELGALYVAFSRGEPSPLPELQVQYPDYALWQRRILDGRALRERLDYWRRQLAGMPERVALPFDLRASQHPVELRDGGHPFELPDGLTAKIDALAREAETSRFVVLLGTLATLLYSTTAQDDLVIAADVSGRDTPATEALIGFFVNMVLLRCDLSGDPRFRELLGRIRPVVLEGLARADLPFDRLVQELRPGRSADGTELAQVVLSYQNAGRPEVGMGDLDVEVATTYSLPSKRDLTLFVRAADGGLAGRWSYDPRRFDRSTIERLAARYRELLERATDDPDLDLDGLRRATAGRPGSRRKSRLARLEELEEN